MKCKCVHSAIVVGKLFSWNFSTSKKQVVWKMKMLFKLKVFSESFSARSMLPFETFAVPFVAN